MILAPRPRAAVKLGVTIRAVGVAALKRLRSTIGSIERVLSSLRAY